MGELTTIILRFRDLVTARGQTIRQHTDISEKDGSVWWGWWSKFGETVPDDAFRALNKQAHDGGLEIFLMDSGQELLYRTTCSDIKWDQDHQRIKVPEGGPAPGYYSDQSFLAWFKLRGIEGEDNPKSCLSRWSYVKVDDFFEDKKSRYTPFYGKQVSSVSELRQQDRTIWFLKPFEPGDPTHEVSLLDRYSVTPEHFSSDYFQTPLRELLWVSDLHFSEDGHHAFPLVEADQVEEFNLGHQIEHNLKDLKSRKEPVAGVIISGDITWKADPKEFRMAEGFIWRLSSWSPLRSNQIAVCPGNHDLKFSADPADKNAPIKAAAEVARQAYSEFYEKLFYMPAEQPADVA